MRSELKSMNRAGYVAIAAACTLPLIAAVGAWRSGVDVFVMAVVVVVAGVSAYALVAVPDRKRAALAAPTDLYRGSAQLNARRLRKTETFREQFKHARTGLLIYGETVGDLRVGENGIIWRPGRSATRRRIPEVRLGWEQIKNLRIIVAPGIRDPASVFANLPDGTAVEFTINRYRDLERGLAKGNYVNWDVIR